MSTIQKTCLAAMAAALMAAPVASADSNGLLLGERDLSVEAYAQLTNAIATARVMSPEAFEAVHDIVAEVVELDANKRGGLAPVALLFKHVGKDAVMPLLSLLVVQGPNVATWPQSARDVLVGGALQAIAWQEDPRASAVLHAALDRPDVVQPYTVGSLTEALGRLGDDAAAQHLLRVASEAGPKRTAVLQSLGYCRRPAVARFLAEEIAATTDVAAATLLAQSLGDLGNIGYWRFHFDHADRTPVQLTATEALLTVMVSRTGQVQTAARKALVVIRHERTEALATQAFASATPAAKKAIERLLKSLTRKR